ncbi:hypothetical protein [Solirubrum puertoriconensis]|uniref:Uncharacterized protein n=1 Tax=Solirubrum puertoriconensis TaxID=1751427 RepID=A0A9X0L4Y3_SOLP1|nr:hypothetical protein [Solirubrum puertoriconensis]KUG08149.1 hypothetical protein ASU33_08115 [Solirubrum puertoriconensis]
MSQNRSFPGIVFTNRNTPTARAELAERFKQFHAAFLRKASCEEVLKVYTRAFVEWSMNPNTDVYQMELLFDEIYHASKIEDAEEQDSNE